MRRKLRFGNHKESHYASGSLLRDIILGGQDGIVNVLGIVLGVATVTSSTKIVLVSGLAATFAESISMGAVAYTSMKAARDYYRRKLAEERREIKISPEGERAEVRAIFARKGFRGRVLDSIVKHITSSKKLWLKTMMREELGLSERAFSNPLNSAVIVGFSSVFGSIIPLIPFFVMDPSPARWWALGICSAVLFVTGSVKARVTVGSWWKSGLEMMAIGMASALAGYLIGLALGAI